MNTEDKNAEIEEEAKRLILKSERILEQLKHMTESEINDKKRMMETANDYRKRINETHKELINTIKDLIK